MIRTRIGYPRVSTMDQARDGVSLPAQEERMRAYAVAQNLGAIEIRREAGRSGKSIAGRPEFRAILDEIKAGKVEALIVFKLDRLARNTIEALEIVKILRAHNCRLISLSETLDTGTALGKFFYTMLAALAEMESNQISERTKEAARYKRSKSEVFGYVPYGRRAVQGKLVEDDAEMAVLHRMREMRGNGKSLGEISRALIADNVPTKRGGRWTPATVRAILKAAM